VKPLPAALATGAVGIAAITLSNPLFPAAAAFAGALLLLAAGPPRRIYAAFAVATGVTVFVLEPFVAVQGLTTLWQGPDIPILDTQITAEELAYGAAAGLRIAATALAAGAFVRLADSDLLLRAVARVAPRSAMIGSLTTQMLPALERDAAGVLVAARTRAARITRPATAARLMGPLVGMSLERALGVAEAMEARGYAGPVRSSAPVRRLSRREQVLTGIGAASTAVVVAALVTGAGDFRYFDLLDDPWTVPAVTGAACVALLGATFAWVARCRS
jgi:energy-coupling factor transport system permease protein